MLPDLSSITIFLEVATSLKTIFKHNVLQFCDGKMGAVNGLNMTMIMTTIGLLTTMIWRCGHKSDNNKRWVKGGGIDHSTVQSEEMWTGVSQLDSVKSQQFY